jgi:type I restriction enzyme M protein
MTLPKGCDWSTLRDLSGTDLIDNYTDILRKLSREKGNLGDIFIEAQCRFNNPVPQTPSPAAPPAPCRGPAAG